MIVDRLTESAHFLPVNVEDSLEKLAHLYVDEIGDRVFLKISHWKGVLRFGKRGKLSSRYIGLYEIVSKVGPIAYKLKLPLELSRIHDTFHVSLEVTVGDFCGVAGTPAARRGWGCVTLSDK